MEIEITHLRFYRNLALAGCLVVPALFGVGDLLLHSNPIWPQFSTFLQTLAEVLLVVLWCRLDAALREYETSAWLRILTWLAAIIAVPIYLSKTRGVKGAAKIGFGLPILVGASALYYAGWYGSRWIGEMTGYFQK